MRTLDCLGVIATVSLLALPAHAQTVAPPAIGLPLPAIGLPLPPLGLPLVPDRTPPSVTPSPTPPPPLPAPPAAVVFFGVAPHAWGFAPWQQSAAPGVIAAAPAPPPAAPDAETGTLRLEIRPAAAQLFIDGEFVGTWADHGGQLELAPGTRRLEVRAPAYQPLAVDIRIVAGREVTYRGELERVETARRPKPKDAGAGAAPAPSVAHQADTPAVPPAMFYLIPGCYLGNVPPAEVKLPDGCDLSRMITHRPQR